MQLHLTLLAVMLHIIDSLNFNLKSLHKQAVAVFEEVSTAVLLEVIVYVFKLHWFSPYFQEVYQLAYAN